MGDYNDSGYELALREMVGELVIELRNYDFSQFAPHSKPSENTEEAERTAKLLYFVIRSDPLQRTIREKLVGITPGSYTALYIAVEILLWATGLELSPEMVVAANVLLYKSY